MNCVILGGGGFIGSHLSGALVEAGHTVRIFDRPELTRRNLDMRDLGIEWIEGDFLNQQDVVDALSGFDIAFHLVSTTLPKSSNENPVYDVESNVVSTLRFLDIAQKVKIKKVIFVSSGGTIYGVPQETPIAETHPTNPICSYGIGKLAIEKYLHLYHVLHNLDYCILRLANPYGEGQRVNAAQGAVAVFLGNALNNDVIRIWGDGTVVRDYVYIGDAVNAFIRAIAYTGDTRVFNIGGGKGYSVNEIIDAIERLIGRSVAREYLSPRSFDVPVNVLDIESAKRRLGWQPKVGFDEGLARTFRWLCEAYGVT